MNEEYSFPLFMLGSASVIYSEPDEADDAVAKLHEVVGEVTGVAVPVKEKPRMGFL